MRLKQPMQLLHFMTMLDLQADGTVQKKYFDNDFDYISNYFTPELKVSKLAVDMQDVLYQGVTFVGDATAKDNELMKLEKFLDFKHTDKYAYRMLQMISIEVFSLITVQDLAPETADEYSQADAIRLHNNINFLIEYLNDKYESTVDNDIDLDTSVIIYRINKLLRQLDTDSMYMYKVISGYTIGGGNSAV